MNKISELTEIALKYNTDKWGHHWYTNIYDFFLNQFRSEPVKMLEIGVGGYEFPDRGGGSLKMWKEYFQNGAIWSIDIHDKSQLQEDRITILKGSQDDLGFLNEVYNRMGGLDIVVDDGSHICTHQLASFNHLFPKLSEGGIYIIEDTETSYWQEGYGGSTDLNHPLTTMNYFRALAHGLNHSTIPNYPVTDFNKNILGISFYRNLIIIQKGENRQ